ncbi:Bug family tripartite tricarboxylate transporter substrate binding protein [Advenella mimigardefordensis]|uniref:Putative Bug-like extracytoplasmic solute binding receptor, TTT family n=1 Tax=Advenella mimigardefordensis (strain DSM 17166 / LMG 22922 / DPN7) TaxID=1247726 RepID=W0P8V3_ADVMD|nr:tripartite tricarboxylate transporter substrate binding protein [Advenella mimigardefordensis]AHG63269.1 putative Bug-like extracytoplasmic solute binding receptor, TTT family [Advenella mimigardefordensis DPN7]
MTFFKPCMLAVLLAASPLTVHAAYPDQPIRLVVPHPAGGSSDILARTMAAAMSKDLGQSIVVENKGGGNGAIAAQTVANAKPDGYTLLLATASTHGINPTLYRKLNYDAIKDFAPVTLFATVPNVLVVGAAHKQMNSLKDLLQFMKDNPGKTNMGSAGSGTPGHLAGVMLKDAEHLDLVHVPFKGGAPVISALIGGQIDFMFTTIPGAISHIKAGSIKGLAVSSAERSDALPELPTVAEAGVPGFEAVSWHGLVAPAKTPQPVIDALYQAASKALNSEDVKSKLANEGARAAKMTPDEFGAFIQAQINAWGAAVKSSGARAD